MSTSTLAGEVSGLRQYPAVALSALRPERMLVCIVLFALPIPWMKAYASTLPMLDFAQMATRCGPSVDTSTLASVAATESGFEPLSVHDNTTGATATMRSADQGAAMVDRLIAGGHSVDVGLMQINSANFRALDLTAARAFDPCASIAAAAALLSQAYAGGTTHGAQQAALRAALSTYNTGNPESGIRNGYVRRVELAAAHIVPAIDVPTPNASISAARPRPTAVALPSDWEIWSEKETASQEGGGAESPIIDFKGEDTHG